LSDSFFAGAKVGKGDEILRGNFRENGVPLSGGKSLMFKAVAQQWRLSLQVRGSVYMHNCKFDTNRSRNRYKHMNGIFGYEKSLYLFDGLALDSIIFFLPQGRKEKSSRISANLYAKV
jgi:hypothetical protein